MLAPICLECRLGMFWALAQKDPEGRTPSIGNGEVSEITVLRIL